MQLRSCCFLVLDIFWKISVHLNDLALSQVVTMLLQRASRGLISLKIHMAGYASAWSVQSMIPPPPFLIGSGVAFASIHFPILLDDPFSVWSISGFFVHKKDLASEMIQDSTSGLWSMDQSQ